MELIKIFITFSLLCSLTPAPGQGRLPVNTNLLIDNGISPKVLDAALSTTLQEGAFVQDVHATRQVGARTERTHFQFVYDPAFREGIDIQVRFNADSIGYLKKKELLRSMQEMHSFSRMSQSYLYDESSLKVVSINEDSLILSFLYDPKKLEPELKYGKKLNGLIYIVNGELEKVVLKNRLPIRLMKNKIEAGNFTEVTFYKRVKNAGGHIVSGYTQEYTYSKHQETVRVRTEGVTTEYKDENGLAVDWEAKEEAPALTGNVETLTGSLGGPLPILGKGARKLGYSLPRPVGVNLFSHQQAQVLQFTDLQAGANDSELLSFKDLFDLSNSTVDQFTRVTMVKADVWILPFLNIMGVFGTGRNTIDGSLFLDEGFKEALSKLGWLVGLKPEDIPDYLPIQSDLSALTYGGGVTLAGGVDRFNLSLSYQLVVSTITEVNTSKLAHVISPMIGYMTPFGMNIMAGAQGQFYNPVTTGFIRLPENNQLNYNVNFEPLRWNLILGLYVPVSNHFELAVQSGWGDRRSLTVVFGYRF